ncbi:MAG: transposase InsO family protein [Lentisphaeria bacterium]
MTVEKISESFLLPALESAMVRLLFRIIGFHSDNGSEFINKAARSSERKTGCFYKNILSNGLESAVALQAQRELIAPNKVQSNHFVHTLLFYQPTNHLGA